MQDSAQRGDIGRHAREERLVGREARRIARTEFEDVLAEHAGLTAFGNFVKEREEQFPADGPPQVTARPIGLSLSAETTCGCSPPTHFIRADMRSSRHFIWAVKQCP